MGLERPFIIGISGGSASGKTLFLKNLVQSFAKGNLCLVSQDDYYKPREEQPLDENNIPNFDTPLSIDSDQLIKDIKALHAGETVQKAEYTFNNPSLKPKVLTYRPSPIIIVEGLFVFYFPELARLLDLKIFLDAKEYVKLTRRIKRDQEERGYPLEDVLYRYERHVAPTYEKYIKPFKNDADFIVPNNLHFNKALEVIVTYLNSKVRNE